MKPGGISKKSLKDKGFNLKSSLVIIRKAFKKRPDAFLKFYESMGFVASHEGMKMHFSAEGRRY